MLLSALLVILVSILLVSWASRRELRRIPGSMGWPLIGESFSFLSDFSDPSGIYSFVLKKQKRYGKVFKTNVFGRFTVFITGREAGKDFFNGKDGAVRMNISYTGKQVLGPTSLLSIAGEEHKHIRRVISEPLSLDALKNHLQFINNLAINTLDGWSGRTVLVLEEASTFTVKVIANMIMSLDPASEEHEKFRANFKTVASSFLTLPINIRGTTFHRGLEARNRLYSMLDSIIYRRRNGDEIKYDFLQTLLKKHSKEEGDDDEDKTKLTDMQLKDNILTLLVAGHETTAAALTWLIKYVEENPDVLQKLREEHRGIQERRNGGELRLTWSEINNMPYTNKVINETLRKATVVPWLSRQATQDFITDGYEIKKGCSVNLDVVSIHNDPKIFSDPSKFDPSRFNEPLRPYSFLGFGSGPRMCPGLNLARLEMCVFIHHLVCRYKWKSLGSGDHDSVCPTFIRMPKNKHPIVAEAF